MTAAHWLAFAFGVIDWLAFALGVVVGQLALLGAIALGMAAKRGDRMRDEARQAGEPT